MAGLSFRRRADLGNHGTDSYQFPRASGLNGGAARAADKTSFRFWIESMNEQNTPRLVRHFGTLQATALNMSNMIGIGPFLTIPLLMSALGGPQAMLGWLIALLIVIPDGMVWSELGAAMPGSGGSYIYLRE